MNGKWIVILLALPLLLGGCGPEEGSGELVSLEKPEVSSAAPKYDCTGQWEITGASQNGLGITLENVRQELGGDISFSLKKGGSVYAKLNNASTDGLWYQDGNRIQLVLSNGEVVELEAEDGQLIMEWEGITLIFEREQALGE